VISRSAWWWVSAEARAALLLCCALVACGDEQAPEASAGDAPPASASASGSAVVPDAFDLPPAKPFDNNPLDLPPGKLRAEVGSTLFTVPPPMLEGAKLGSSLKLMAATVEALEGEDPVVRVGTGRAFVPHPGYTIQLRPGRLERGTLLIVPYRGELHHAVAHHMIAGRVAVRLTDLGRKAAEERLLPTDIGTLRPGELAPGGLAVERGEHELRHVLLVSSAAHDEGERRWLVLGHGGESRLVDEEQLAALPTAGARPKAGDDVLVAFQGRMVTAKLRSVDLPGLFTVQRPRASPALMVGPGMLMHADRATAPTPRDAAP
jgi:hypothetical protein